MTDRYGHAVATKALVTIGSGAMGPVLEQSLPTFREFAVRHGYDLVVGAGDAADGRSPAWAKVPLIRRLLDRYDLVFWIDSDAIILDGSVDPAGLLPPGCFQAMVVNRWQGNESPCTGVWLLRSSDAARRFVDAMWASGEYHHEHPWEQAVAMQLLGYRVWPAERVADTEWGGATHWLAEEWGNIPILRPGRRLEPCRIRHYAATPNPIRRRRMVADRHVIAAGRRGGLAGLRHRALATLGAARWRYVDAPEIGPRLRRRLAGLRPGRS